MRALTLGHYENSKHQKYVENYSHIKVFYSAREEKSNTKIPPIAEVWWVELFITMEFSPDLPIYAFHILCL